MGCADVPLIGGADDEDPHVPAAGCIQSRIVVLPDVIPMQIDVIKSAALAAGGDQIGRTVSGETHMANPTIGLPATNNVHAARRPKRLLQMLRQVDAMNGQEVEALTVESFEGQLELCLKISGIGAGGTLL